ncbi:hypothetical protein [Aquimarina agarilytica]|uniref:hypothetical protein n=1 Tax=Aquimarina agarilytica TaxID=1087449 RepID=UPI0012F898F5|nr:hypothetical protein [Aquimarina agarilytica]
METKMYNKYNYYRNTYAVYKEVNPADLHFSVWHYVSKSGSSYFYTKEGVYRLSNHWGRAAKCRWVLSAADNKMYVSKGRSRIGYAKWGDFYENSESTKAYFIKVDYQKMEVTYDHKSRDTSAQAIYRTAKETQKIIIKVKRLLLTNAWSKYYEYDDLEVLRKELIDELIF